MIKKDVKTLIKILEKKYGDVECYLSHANAFELLCAVILSAQCTDDRVNLTTPALFTRYPSAEKLALAKLPDLEAVIKSCGFYKNKAKNLKAMAKRLVSHHAGEVPDPMEKLTALAGVGRKTANVVLGEWFKKPAGVVVDTHVSRITQLLGLTKEKTPEKIEQDLNKLIPKKYWAIFSLWLIAHGRETCIARRPQCGGCMLKDICKYQEEKANS
jgi:endonuclease-3